MDQKVELFFGKSGPWKEEFSQLRELVLACDLEEEYKWKHPCYTREGNNIVLIHGFKEYCALLFFKGVLLKDPADILVQQTENVQAARQLRFTNLAEIREQAETIKAYIKEAIEVEKAGLEVPMKKTAEYEMPEEFQQRLEDDPALHEAFQSLTPGRQRGYLLYFSQAKQSKTRISRIEKCIPKIMEGKGLQD